MTRKSTLTLLFIVSILFVSSNVIAMSSTRYKIDTDSINFGGTENSTDGLLLLSDTLGEIGSGVSSSTNYSMSAGYRVLQNSYISISAQPDITLPDIGGIVPGQSNSYGSWLVKTDNFAGYQITVHSVTSPALKASSGSFFSDYEPVTSGVADFAFSVGATISNFAFSPEGVDIDQKYLDNGSICGVGSTDTSDKCWDGLSTSEKIVSYRTSSNHPDGSTTTIKYRAAIGSNKIQDSGVYTATIVITALAL